MNTAKHTPGPWLEGRVVATGLPVKFQKYGDDIWWPREQSDEEAQANLRLADAAPELLNELKRVHALISEAAATGFNPMDGDWADRLFRSQGERFYAIAKATGDAKC